MGGTLITLVSDQVVPIVLGALYCHPDHIMYLCSDNPRHQRNINIINRHLSSLFSFTHEKLMIHPYDLDDNLRILRHYVPATDQAICNITGGTKLMAIAAYQAMKEKGIRTFYVDTTNERLILFGESTNDIEYIPIAKLTVADFVRLVGAELVQDQTAWFEQEVERLDKLTALIASNSQRWGRVNRYFHLTANRDSPSLAVETPILVMDRQAKKLLRADEPFLVKLKEAGWLKEVDIFGRTVRYSFPDKTSRDALFNHGLWLEYLVYRALKQSGLMDDIRTGVQIVWEREDVWTEQRVENELDVLATRSSQLIGFSCKSGNKLKDVSKTLNEIDQYTRRLGGTYYKAALVVSGPSLNVVDRKRAEQMGVRIFTVTYPQMFREELISWVNTRAKFPLGEIRGG